MINAILNKICFRMIICRGLNSRWTSFFKFPYSCYNEINLEILIKIFHSFLNGIIIIIEDYNYNVKTIRLRLVLYTHTYYKKFL